MPQGCEFSPLCKHPPHDVLPALGTSASPFPSRMYLRMLSIPPSQLQFPTTEGLGGENHSQSDKNPQGHSNLCQDSDLFVGALCDCATSKALDLHRLSRKAGCWCAGCGPGHWLAHVSYLLLVILVYVSETPCALLLSSMNGD